MWLLNIGGTLGGPQYAKQEIRAGTHTFVAVTRVDVPRVVKQVTSPAEEALIGKLNAQLRAAALKNPGPISQLAVTPVIVGKVPAGKCPWELPIH